MSVPKKLGLVTGHILARKLVKLLQKYLEKLEEFLTSTEFTKVVNLIACLNEFINDVPRYPDDPA